MTHLSLARLALICILPGCAVASIDEEALDDELIDDTSAADGAAAGDGDTTEMTPSGGSALVYGNGGALTGGTTSTGGDLATGGDTSTGGDIGDGGTADSGGTTSGGATSGGASSGGASSGGASSGGASSGGASSGGASSGGASSGGASGSGGSSGGSCPNVGFNVNSGEIGTTGPGCFTATQEPVNGWGAYNCEGRTITINGSPASQGNINWAGSAPYTVEFSAGTYSYCSFSYY